MSIGIPNMKFLHLNICQEKVCKDNDTDADNANDDDNADTNDGQSMIL